MRIIHPGDEFNRAEPSAVALGFFDGIHKGHMAVISAAKATGLHTVVVTFARHPSEVLKDRCVRELMNHALKEKILAELGVDTLVYLDFESVRDMPAETFLKELIIAGLNAKRVFCGFNYRFGRGGEASFEELASICKKYDVVGVSTPPVCVGGQPVSSTRIRALVEAGDMAGASSLLGRPFGVYLKVIHGRSLAREFGTPTINQKMPETLVLPRFGVYASLTHIDGKKLPSVTNVGVKPTVGGKKALAETYIIGYAGNLYEKMVQVDLIQFMRPEVKFENIETLKHQILHDAQETQTFFAQQGKANL